MSKGNTSLRGKHPRTPPRANTSSFPSETSSSRRMRVSLLEQRPSAQNLLSTTEPTLHASSSKTSLPPWRAGRAGRPHPAPPPAPAYRGLFPPYMRDVYAFLAAVHQEVRQSCWGDRCSTWAPCSDATGGGPCCIAVNFRDSTVDGLVYLNLLRR